MGKYKIDNAVAELIPIFTESGYKPKTVAELRRNIQKVTDLHQSHGEDYYNAEIVMVYISELKEKYTCGEMSRTRKNALVKAASYVNAMATTGEIAPGSKEIESKLPPHYSNILDKLEKADNWSEALKRNIIYATHTYFVYLASHNVENVSDISPDLIRGYILCLANRSTSNSLNTIRRNLKHFHRWLHEAGLTDSDFSNILSFTSPVVHRITKPIPHNEIALILDAADRTTAKGKRDYAMFLLATVTGLRSVDIANLKFPEIDWINGEIRLQQEKTGAMLALPLTTDVGEAIKDYILFGRPRSQLETVFHPCDLRFCH